MWGEHIAAVSLAVTSALLLSAALSDARTREVSDVHWLLIGLFGIPLHAVSCADSQGFVGAVSGMAGSLLLLAYMLSERLSGVHSLVALVPAAAMYAASALSGTSPEWVMAPLLFFAVLALYRAGLIRGGADAKALMVLALAFPSFPVTSWTPVLWVPADQSVLVPGPVLTITLLALALSALMCVPSVVRGARSGCGLGACYRMDVRSARGSHVWPLEDSDGETVFRAPLSDDTEGRYDRLEAAGAEDVLVTPMVPFIVPLTASFLAVMVLGDPLMSMV